MTSTAEGRTSKLTLGLFALAVVVTAAFFHFRSPNIPDPDSLYHIHHAALYRTNGLTTSAFPWIAWSIINVYAADIWYGFHLLLVPFSFFRDPALGIKLAGLCITSFLLVSVRWALARQGVTRPSWWPFVLLFAGPNVLFHFTMTRPHVLTAGLCALLFSFVVRGGGWSVFLLSLALSSFHLSLCWMIPAVVLAVLAARLLVEGFAGRSALIASSAGIVAGWLLRPNPLGAMRIAWVQIVDLTMARKAGALLLVGKELLPITGDVIVLNFIPLLILWLAAACLLVLAWRKGRLAGVEPRMKVLIGSSLLLSVAFFAMTSLVARRAFAPWALFVIVFVASVATVCVEPRNGGRLLTAMQRRWIMVGGALLFAFMFVHAAYRNTRNLANACAPEDFREAAEWIAARSREGDIVYNVHWDEFPKLFVWDDTNRYVSGMDPIFQYAYDPALYYKGFHFQLGNATVVTCGAPQCTRDNIEDTFTVLRRDFKATWLFIEKERSPSLYAWVEQDPRFIPGFDSPTQAVFGLEARPGAGP